MWTILCITGPVKGWALTQNPYSAICMLPRQSFLPEGVPSTSNLDLNSSLSMRKNRLKVNWGQACNHKTQDWLSSRSLSSIGRVAMILLKWYNTQKGALLPEVFPHLIMAHILDLKVFKHLTSKSSTLPSASTEWNYFSNCTQWHGHSVDTFGRNSIVFS